VALQALGLARPHALQLARELGILAAKRAHAIWEVRRRLDAAYFRRPPPRGGLDPSDPSPPDDPPGRAPSDSADCDDDGRDGDSPPPPRPLLLASHLQASPLAPPPCPFP
jgi:hypothetical protein